MRRFAIAIALVLAASFAGMAAGELPRAQAAGPVRLVVGVVGRLDQTLVASEITNLQHPTLTALAADTLDPIPGIAEAWRPAPGGWTYTLRAGAAWSDGTPVTSDDVVYSLEQQRDRFPDLVATVVDQRSVTVTGLRVPTLLLNVVPRDPAKGVAGDWQEVERTGEQVTLRVVERPGRPRLDEIAFRSYSDTDALLDALADEDIDVAGAVPASEYARVRAIHGSNAIHANDGDQWILQVRVDEARVRHAIARALDRDDLVATVAGGVGRAHPIPIVARGRQWQLDRDVAAAIAADLAYRPDAPTIAARFSLAAADDDTDGEVIAGYVADALTAAGFEVDTVTPGADADVTVVRRDPGDDPAPALERYLCSGGVWCDARYDAAFETFATTTDAIDRVELVHQMVALIATEAVEVVLYEPDVLQAFRTDRVSGMLREPRDERLVVFWPSIQQYYEAVPTATLGGEDIPDSAFAGIAAAVVLATLGILALPKLRASGRRRRETRSRP